eukprot:2399414-Prymnesium_polylepis.1
MPTRDLPRSGRRVELNVRCGLRHARTEVRDSIVSQLVGCRSRVRWPVLREPSRAVRLALSLGARLHGSGVGFRSDVLFTIFIETDRTMI